MVVAISELIDWDKMNLNSSGILLMGANSGSVGRGKPFVPTAKKQSVPGESYIQRVQDFLFAGCLTKKQVETIYCKFSWLQC
jgi:hypothetical protein